MIYLIIILPVLSSGLTFIVLLKLLGREKFSFPLVWQLKECSRCGKFLSLGSILYEWIDYTENEEMKEFLREGAYDEISD